MVNTVKKLLLSIVLIIFLVFPLTTIAEEPLQTVTDTANIISNVTLLSPATWPLSISIRAISGLIGAGSSVQCAGDANLLTSPYCAIIGFVVELQKTLAIMLVDFGQTLLTINTNSDLLTQASSQNNIIVQSGWGIVRNIANAALVIGLIIIAITIILGYQENKAKQVLINFILIALLINFTPVICSFIIDGSNVLTSSFLAGGTDTGFTESIGTAYNILHNDTSIDPIKKIGWGTIYLFFAIIATVIMCLYGLLFMARTAILWILVIVSPVAFATKVFPQSKYIKKVFPSVTYWDDWWESFLQWTLISIPAAISLYISIQLMSVVGPSVSAMTDKTALDTLMAFATPFIFMIAGFFITISSGGQIGSFVGGVATGMFTATAGRAIGWGKEKAKAGGEWALEGAKGTVAGAALGTLNSLNQGVISGIKGGLSGGLTPEGRERAAKEIAEVKEGLGWTKRGEYASKLKGDVEASQKRISNLSEDEQRKILYSDAITRQGGIDRIGVLKELTKNGDLKTEDLNFIVQNKKMLESLGGDLKEVSKARPDYAPQLVNKTAYDVVSGMPPAEAGKKINSPAFASPSVLFSTHYNVINGKIKKGSAEDIKNIKSGLVEELNNYLGAIPGANFPQITAENIADQIQNNYNIIDTYLETLRNNNDEASSRKEKTLSELLNHVVDGNI